MRRKLLCLFFTAVMLLLIGIEALAVSGTILVDIGGKGQVTLYHVGKAEGADYRLSEQYGGGLVTFDDILSPNLAAWLAQGAKEGISRETVQGIAEFTGLEEGLYLVVQTEEREEYEIFSPFLVSLPWDGTMWEVEVTPIQEETPQTGDTLHGYLFLLLLSAGILAIKAVPFQRKWRNGWFCTGQKAG